VSRSGISLGSSGIPWRSARGVLTVGADLEVAFSFRSGCHPRAT
jgi:hypothetical protein